MRIQKFPRLIRPVLAGMAPALLAVGVAMAAAPSGAIFTTDQTGALVNGNIYTDKSNVFLNGGPPANAPCTSSGLPDGNYYFQVTDPSGATLLSSDDISNRQVTVSGGLIVAYTGNGVQAPHATGPGKCVTDVPSNISVGLAPFNDTPNVGGEYKTWVTLVSSYDPNLTGFFGFAPSQSKTDNFKVVSATTPPSKITGYKFYDSNANGVQDPGEPGIPGWHIEKVPGAPDIAYTDPSGQYQYIVNQDGTVYTISEFAPGGWFPIGVWQNTTATSGTATANAANVAGPNFGNVCLGAGGGLTLGFWSNKNGQALIGPTDLSFLSSQLNLRNANGSNFDPTSGTQLRSWLLNATATNMAYMLSAQLAAMELNVTNSSGVNGNALIYAPGAHSANTFGFATVNAVMTEANTELGLHGLTLSGSAYRSYQEALKNALDRANNNLTFIQVPVNGAIPCTFDSPYVPV